MISSWRRLRAAHRARKVQLVGLEEAIETELTIPSHFRCPISLDLMKDPVTLSTGITYDRESIEKWIDSGNQTCPITNQTLRSLQPVPNHALRRMIQDWCVENRSFGIERIPTPRVPVNPLYASEILKNIASASERGDRDKCIELVVKAKALIRESDRNKRCFSTHGAATVLASSFEIFSKISLPDENTVLLVEILSVLASLFPLDGNARSHLGSPASVNRTVSLLRSSGDLSARRNSVLALKEIVSSDRRNKAEAIANIDGAMEAIYNLIKEPICPTTTKAALVIAYRMTSLCPTDEKIITRFVKMGLVNNLVEVLVDADRSMCEKALGVLDGICNTKLGRDATRGHSLAVAVLVKKLLRVSDLATEFSVSVLWKLTGRDDQEDDDSLVEALRAGAFQKLLLLLQVGCGDRTKEKVSELLKRLNLRRKKLDDCLDSHDFIKDVKSPF